MRFVVAIDDAANPPSPSVPVIKTPMIHSVLLAIVVLLLRGLLIGQPPFTDEGNYISTAYHLWHHPFQVVPSLCPVSSISLYSGAFCWLFAFCSDGFLAFRFVDALVTLLCTFIFYTLLKQLSRNPRIALWLTLVWVLCVNHPVFINAGFKNPYSPGFACIFYAFLLLTRAAPNTPIFRIGNLLGLAFLFRAPLLVYAVPVTWYLLQRWGGWKTVLNLIGGILSAVATGFIVLALLRGGEIANNTRNILTNWAEISAMHRTLLALGHYDLPAHMFSQLRATLNIVGWAVPIWLISIGAAILTCRKSAAERPLIWLAGLAAIAPLPEFILKLGFPYHLSACLARIAMLGAIGLGGNGAVPSPKGQRWCP